jgi:Uma2 family endonuclease
MPVVTFICPIIEEPWRGSTRRRPALAVVKVGAGNIWNADEIAPGVMLIVVDADDAKLSEYRALAGVKEVLDIDTSVDVPQTARQIAKDFDALVRARFARRVR